MHHKTLTASLLRGSGYGLFAGLLIGLGWLLAGAVSVGSGAATIAYPIQIGPLTIAVLAKQSTPEQQTVSIALGADWWLYLLLCLASGLVYGWWAHRRAPVHHDQEEV